MTPLFTAMNARAARARRAQMGRTAFVALCAVLIGALLGAAAVRGIEQAAMDAVMEER
jgi:hypothetical protein